jgi:signal transduction histidine kinase
VRGLSLRSRLTLIYSSLFLATGTVLVALNYLQTAKTVDAKLSPSVPAVYAYTVATPMPGTVMATQAVPAQLKSDLQRQIAQQKQEILHQLLLNSLFALVALGLPAVGIGYVVAGRTLRPLHRVTTTARRLSESTLHQRIGLDGPKDEIKELADTFDAMLDRLDRAFDSQRRFVANASHELRTPLTINRAVLEVTLAARATSEETKVLARTLLGTTERHERLIEGLLLLARSERELGTRTRADLRDLTRSALEQLGDRAEEAGITVVAELSPAGTEGDPVLLERCAVNLIENAIKYNVANGEVRVRTGEIAGASVLRVENTGPHVQPHEISTIFEPFRRLRAERVGSAQGAGLGLSIVRAVAQAHGGSVEATPRPGGGLIVTLGLPARPAHGTRTSASPATYAK